MPVWDTSVLWQEMITRLNNRSQLTALLGTTAGAPSIAYGWPNVDVGFPLLTIEIRDDQPLVGGSKGQQFRPRWQFDVFADSATTIAKIHGQVREVAEVPRRNPTIIDLTAVQMTAMWEVGSYPVPRTGFKTPEGIPIRQRTIEYVSIARLKD